MCNKLISLMFFVLVLSLTSSTYSVVIGDFENPSDPNNGGWIIDDPNITTSYSTNGVTLNNNSLRINSPIVGSTGGFRRALVYSLIGQDQVDEFRNNLKISLDITRLYGDWVPEELLTGEWSELILIIEAGSTLGVPWALGAQLSPEACWGTADEELMSVTYDYSLVLNQIDFDNLEYLGIVIATNWGLYNPGGVYYIDNIQMFGGGPAYDPNPADHAIDIQSDLNLSWTPGAYADKHDVYFGTSFNDVNDADRFSHSGLLHYKENHDSNHYDPGILEFYTTYYWRIDEVNGPNVWKGPVWEFMTAYPGMGVVIGDWEEGMNGWAAAWQGDTALNYSTTGVTLGNYSLGVQTVRKDPLKDPGYWILERRGLLDLTDMRLDLDIALIASEWDGEQIYVEDLCVQSDLGWRVYSPTVIYRDGLPVGGTGWRSFFGDTYRTYSWDFSGPDDNLQTWDDWADATWMRILLSLKNDFQGLGTFYLDNARLLDVHLASNPEPATNVTGVDIGSEKTCTLSWTAGKNATTHDVYFGTDENALELLESNHNQTSYGPVGPLERDKTYYWRIDERGAPGSPWEGLVWHFTTANFSTLDNFEDYDNTSNKIQDTWEKGGGGNVGYSDPDYAEVTIFHSGEQSMPFDYNNIERPCDSNASRTFEPDPCDWTAEGVEALSLWFRGWPAAVGSFVESTPGTYIITSSGEDIWDVSDLRNPSSFHDEFHYAYEKITGTQGSDVTIIAKIESVGPTDPWAKAGVMIRQSLDPKSIHGLMCMTPEMGVAFQHRDTAGGLSISYDYETAPAMADANAPYWVRLTLTKAGYLKAYYSTNPNAGWSTPITISSSLTAPFYVGLAVTAHNPSETCTAEFSNVSITASGMTISQWNHQDIGIKSNDAALLYVALQDDESVGGDTAIVTHTDPNIVLQNTWQVWDIAFSDFIVDNPNLNLEKIKKITVGVGNRPDEPCGAGTLYFDDIRLYMPRCMPDLKPDLTGDCFIDYDDLQILTSEWLSSPSDPNIDLYEDEKIDLRDYAILASEWFEELLWP